MPLVGGRSHWIPDATEQPRIREELTTGLLLDEAAAQWPDHEAVVYAAYAEQGIHERWTYAELRHRARAVAKALLGSGLAKGDRAAVWATNVPEWLLLQFGCAYAGIVLVPLNPLYRTDEVADIVGRSGARIIFVVPTDRGASLWDMAVAAAAETPALEILVALGTPPSDSTGTSWDAWLRGGDVVSDAELDEAIAAVGPEDIAQIQYTSGTTGAPKGVLLRHVSTTNNARLFAHRAEMPRHARVCSGMPLFHCGGSVLTVLGAVVTGSTIMPLLSFDARKAIDIIDSERATFLAAVWAMQLAIEEQLDRSGGSLQTLELCGTGGSLVPPEILRRWQSRFGTRSTITYGLTEASPVISQTSPSDDFEHQAATVGRALPHVEIDVVDPEGKVVAVGLQGEIRTRGWLVMAGYHLDPEATARAISDDGWLHSGDLGTMDADGYLRVTGRAKDMVIRGGENIYPTEIEAALREFGDVTDAQVVGVPDVRYGEVCAAFLRMAPGAAELSYEDMKARLDGRLARYKVPAYLRTVEDFPVTPSGKVQKFKLREQLLAELEVSA